MATALHGGTAPLAALTTVFTPPCPTSWLVTTTKLPSQFPQFPPADPVTSCDPPAWASNLAGEGFQYYSPAICPDGFEVGPNCQLTGTPRTTEGFPPVAPGETVAWCVPSGQTCTSDTTDFRGGIWGVSLTATGASVTVTVGPMMQIRWRDVDLSILATHPLTPGLTLAGAAITPSGPGPGPAPPGTTSTRAADTPTTVRLTPDAASSQSTRTTDSSSSTTTTTAGFFTITGKSTQSSTLQPVTSTLTVVSAGSTFMSTVLTSPTAAANPDGNAASGSTSNGTAGSTTSNGTTGGGVSSKAFVATIVMACLLSVAAAAIIAFFLLWRRRYLRQQQQQQQQQQSGGVLERGQGGQPNPEGLFDGSSSMGLSSVGVGVWVQRPRPRWQVAWRRTKAWWSGVRLAPGGRARRLLTGDHLRSLWKRERGLQQQQQRTQREMAQTTERARTPLAELPTSERVLAEFAELEGSPLPQDLREADNDSDSDSHLSIRKFKGIPSRKPGAASTANRPSWMARLSRYMRGGRTTPSVPGGRDTPSSVYDDAGGIARSVLSRASTRSSRWTRADTASVMTGRGGLDDDDCPFGGDDVPESSWEAFSRSREGLGRLLLVKQKGGHCPEGRRGHTRGLSVPNNGSSGSNIPRPPSPAVTTRSERLLGADANGFSRLSNGTFGRMDSFISCDGSRAGGRASGEGVA